MNQHHGEPRRRLRKATNATKPELPSTAEILRDAYRRHVRDPLTRKAVARVLR